MVIMPKKRAKKPLQKKSALPDRLQRSFAVARAIKLQRSGLSNLEIARTLAREGYSANLIFPGGERLLSVDSSLNSAAKPNSRLEKPVPAAKSKSFLNATKHAEWIKSLRVNYSKLPSEKILSEWKSLKGDLAEAKSALDKKRLGFGIRRASDFEMSTAKHRLMVFNELQPIMDRMGVIHDHLEALEPLVREKKKP
jgi:hypothetical protein